MSGTLTTWLRARSDADLADLLAARPDLATPVPGDVAVLAARVGVRVSVLRALEQLDSSALELLEGLLLLPEPTTVDALLALTRGVTRSHVQRAVDAARALSLVWGPDDELHVLRTVGEVLGDRAAGLGRPAAACLSRYGPDRLAPLLVAAGLAPRTGREGALAALLAAYADPAHLATLLAAAQDDERRVLTTLDAGGGVGATAAALHVVPLAEAETPVERLLSRGLLLGVDHDTVELPREVGLALRGEHPLRDLHPEPPPHAGHPVGQRRADDTGGGQAAETVRLVEALLDGWGAAPVAVLRSGGLGVRDLRAAARSLEVEEPVAALLIETAYAAALLDRTTEQEPEWQPTPGYDSWLARDPGERWALLAAGWLASPRVPALVGERDERDKVVAALGPDVSRPGAAMVRREVLSLLAEVGSGDAVPPEDLLAWASWRAPRRAGRLRERATAWTLEEAAVLGVTGRGALTSAGRHLLAGDVAAAATAVAARMPERVATLLLQADLTAVAPGPLVPEVARELRLMADVESAGAASVHRFSESSVRRALDAGRTAEEVQSFLGRVSSTGVPQTLAYLVDDVARRHGVLRAGAASSYLRCDDEALLAEVAGSRRTMSVGLRRLAPTVLVSPSPVPRLLEVLRAAGYAPVAEGAEGAVVLSRRDERRTPVRARVVRTELAGLSGEQVARAVRALREGDAAALTGRRSAGPSPLDGGAATPLRDRSAAATVAVLQQAVREEGRVVLEYVDPGGRVTERVVVPRGVQSGFLTAFDERAGATRSFALASIAGVSAVA